MLRPFFLFIGSLLGTPAEKEPREPSLAAKIVYCGAGLTLESASLLARFGWKVSLLTPWASTYGRECLYFSQILDHAAHHALVRMLQDSTPSNTQSWRQNLELLSQVPVSSEEEQRLLHFLEKHWLAKVSGYFSWWVNWVSPCFGAFVQVHPETTGFYSRNPGINLPEAYKNRVNAWKKLLPHPYEFPLLLTRPCDIREYLPSCLEVSQGEEVGATIERLKNLKGKAALDLTNVLNTQDPKEWLLSWEDYRNRFLQTCEEGNVDAKQIICIQKILPNGIGAIRQLPLKSGSIDRDHQYLLDWISSYGLTASRIELDRWPAASALHREAVNPISLLAKEEYISSLDSIETSWRSAHPQKTLMVQGALHILKGLLASVSKDRWEEILDSPTRSALVQLSISKIQDRLSFLSQNEKRLSFFETTSALELIHADLSALIEVFSPFAAEDFPQIYRNLELSIPSRLKKLTDYGLHCSGMTNLAGTFKAVEKSVGRPPRILYGENAYFENIHAAHLIGNASPADVARPEDWEEVDLILAQFNPALKRINFKVTEYKVEKIADFLEQAFGTKRKKPFTLAIDCTFDYIDSPQVEKLLAQFQEQIETGLLNVICYRSGLKFDLFGMDNYCGAPFMMIHSPDCQWSSFSSLSNDPVLQADLLSLNWFCLAYKYAASDLELYRKQTFENTKELLKKLPSRLFDSGVRYRVIPMDENANLGFIDLKVYGPFHQARASLVIGGLFTIDCMESGHPLFNRSSVGFYHPNICVLYAEECSTIRFTLGLDPSQIAPLVHCFEKINSLNL